MWYRLSRTQGRFTPYSLETVNDNSEISIAKARRELGYSPRPLSETIRDTARVLGVGKGTVIATLKKSPPRWSP